MKILLLEDDHLQAPEIRSTLEGKFHGKVDHLKTEESFYRNFSDIEKSPPHVFIIDGMLRWSDPAPDVLPPPDEVKADGFYRAGLRCIRLILQSQKIKDVPIILYTVLEDSDLEKELKDVPPNVSFLSKSASFDDLVKKISSVTKKI